MSRFSLKPMQLEEALNDFYRMRENPGSLGGMPTGYNDLDYITNGLPPGEMVVLAARPSVGKSALVLNIVLNGGESGFATAFFSQEMTRRTLWSRLASIISGVPATAIRQGYIKYNGRIFDLEDSHYDAYEEGLKRVAELPLYICEGHISTDEMRQVIIESTEEGMKLDLIVDDYIQLHTDGGGSSDNASLTRVAHNLQSITQDFNIGMVAVSQLSRDVEKRGGGEAEYKLSDLRGSGSIEQVADQVWFLDRADYWAPAAEQHQPKRGSSCTLIVAKNRNGELGRIDLHFDKTTTRFEAVTKEK